ncbi:MAG: GAF domain-containing sensor histidine kinase, partial [Syntrophorhabdus sp.]
FSLVELGNIIALDLLIDAILVQIGKKACEALGADRYSVFLYDVATNELITTVALGMGNKQIRIAVNSGLAGFCFQTGKTVNIRNAYKDERFNKDVDSLTGYHTKTLLSTPFYNRLRKPIGVVQLLNKKKGFFTKEDEVFLQTFNNYAAVFIEMAQLQKARFDAMERSRQELERLNRVKNKALDHLSHELKTPLAVTQGSLRILRSRLRKKYDDESFDRLMDYMENNLQRLLAIHRESEKIINVSHELETGIVLDDLERLWRKVDDCTGIPPDVLIHWNEVKAWMIQQLPGIPIPIKRVDVTKHIQTAISKARHLGSGRRIHFDIIDSRNSYVTINPEVLRDTLDGILQNAIENTPDGGSVRISVSQFNNRTIIEIKDTGTGIRDENQQFIFDGLYHTTATDLYSSKKPYEFGAGGKGLNLFRLKTYAQQFGFTIKIASKRCPGIPAEDDVCPGDLVLCDPARTSHYCVNEGGTLFALEFPTNLTARQA